jgi:hypothetical protein
MEFQTKQWQGFVSPREPKIRDANSVLSNKSAPR